MYRGRLERIAKHSATNREKQVLRHIYTVLSCNRTYFNHICKNTSVFFVLFAANGDSKHQVKGTFWADSKRFKKKFGLKMKVSLCSFCFFNRT